MTSNGNLDDHRGPTPTDLSAQDIVHYGPGDQPLSGADSWLAAHTADPAQVQGCEDCLELVAEDLADDNEYRGRCLHCRQQITALGGVAWRRVVQRPCSHCGKTAW